MPTLQFKGKNIIWNNHLAVPYHTLDEAEKLHFQPEKADGNLIIEGDNLLALKALLPQYAGKIKCIYIDPPYNTGNEHWVYNDNVNNPMMKEWLGKEVDKDDLTRHDKWLCMIVPRLKLLRELLSDDGVIFISTDDTEQNTMRQILNEVFGEDKFIANVIWQKRTSPDNRLQLGAAHDFIITYSKKQIITKDFFNMESLSEERKYEYKNPDKDPRGPWASVDITGQTGHATKDQYYEIIAPSGKKYIPPEGRCWAYANKTIEELIKDNRIWFGKDSESRPRIKRFLSEVEGSTSWTWWPHEEVGHNQEATKELVELLGKGDVFDNPKPTRLIKRILALSTSKDSIILDSFAGSGTTMHAVMDLNKEDGGNRKCIMVQMTEAAKEEPKKNICKDITRERVKRAIEKYGYDSGFKYYKVGIPLDAETLLSGKLPGYNQFAEYVYYLCTGESLKDKAAVNEKTFFVGESGPSVIYLIYKQDFETLTKMALNLDLAEKLIKDNPKKRIIVYAPACFLEEDYLREHNIDYVGIPYNLFQRGGER